MLADENDDDVKTDDGILRSLEGMVSPFASASEMEITCLVDFFLRRIGPARFQDALNHEHRTTFRQRVENNRHLDFLMTGERSSQGAFEKRLKKWQRKCLWKPPRLELVQPAELRLLETLAAVDGFLGIHCVARLLLMAAFPCGIVVPRGDHHGAFSRHKNFFAVLTTSHPALRTGTNHFAGNLPRIIIEKDFFTLRGYERIFMPEDRRVPPIDILEMERWFKNFKNCKLRANIALCRRAVAAPEPPKENALLNAGGQDGDMLWTRRRKHDQAWCNNAFALALDYCLRRAAIESSSISKPRVRRGRNSSKPPVTVSQQPLTADTAGAVVEAGAMVEQQSTAASFSDRTSSPEIPDSPAPRGPRRFPRDTSTRRLILRPQPAPWYWTGVFVRQIENLMMLEDGAVVRAAFNCGRVGEKLAGARTASVGAGPPPRTSPSCGGSVAPPPPPNNELARADMLRLRAALRERLQAQPAPLAWADPATVERITAALDRAFRAARAYCS